MSDTIVAPRPAAARRVGLRARHPEWWAWLLIAAAWVAVVATHGWSLRPGWRSGAGSGDGPHAHLGHGSTVDGGVAGEFAGQVGSWTVMSVAMMVPLALPALRYVVLNSFVARRQRSLTIFVIVFIGVVAAPGMAAAAIVVAADHLGASATLVGVGALAVSAGWQLTRWKRRALLSCHRVEPLRPTGRRADRSVADFAVRRAANCLRSCGPLMVAMTLASTGLLAMVAATAVTIAEERSPQPLRFLRPTAVALAALAAARTIAAVT